MFIPSEQGADASSISAASTAFSNTVLSNAVLSDTTPPVPREQVRHMLFGTPAAVQSDIRHMHKIGYADVHSWSRLMSTGRANEVMAVLTKKVEIS